MDVENKVAIVTGGTGGIGKAIVLHFLENNIKHVSILDVNDEEGTTFEKELNKQYGNEKVLFIKTDVMSYKNFKEAFEITISKFENIDIVVNDAGILDDKNFERVIDVNLNGVIRGTYLGLKYMSKQNEGSGGVILNIGSTAAFTLHPALPVYTASKWGVIGFVRNIGYEQYSKNSGVNVVALCPGRTPTNITKTTSDEILKHIKNYYIKINQLPNSKQTTKTVAKSAVYVIKHGETGSVWIVDGCNLYKQEFVDFFQDPLKELVIQNI